MFYSLLEKISAKGNFNSAVGYYLTVYSNRIHYKTSIIVKGSPLGFEKFSEKSR